MEIRAKITGVKYRALLCKRLTEYRFSQLSYALNEKREATFKLQIGKNSTIALSWWVSPKRTRSYPYARVYDSLDFSGKRVTIIPVIKDEGARGDRDFIQWDTVAMMSLIGVYVILSYYSNASKNPRYENKITNQVFDLDFIQNEVRKLVSYQSDALHWNVAQVDHLGELADLALRNYKSISDSLDVKMHSEESAKRKIEKIKKGRDTFISISRSLAKSAQKREMLTDQPKEKLNGTKARITIENYLGGKYYLTSDEVNIENNNVFLIDGKHTKENKLPSISDIKDALVKMILFTNLEEVKIGTQLYNHIPVVKLTTGSKFNLNRITRNQRTVLSLLKQEAKANNFKIIINDETII